MNKLLIITIFFVLIFIGIQWIDTGLKNDPATGLIQAPPAVMAIFERACFDCHSSQTTLRWYDKIAPVSWLVAADVAEARRRFNFSEWNKLSEADQKGKLWEIYNMADAGVMPPASYTTMHRNAILRTDDFIVLKKYISSLSVNCTYDTAKINAAEKQFAEWLPHADSSIRSPKSLNGIEHNPDYKNWQVMSTTTRFDNGTMRVIYANDLAIAALKKQQIDPFPNGSTLVKVVWEQLADSAGNIRTGKFLNVQYMIWDDVKYAATEGWGFARFETMALIPYGNDTSFDTQCINCHQAVKQNGFVFDIPGNQ